jgi:hypothetical protein
MTSASVPKRSDVGEHAMLAEPEERANERPQETTALKRGNQSLLRMVIGMAVRAYGFDPNVPRSRITKKIADDLRLAGVDLDEGTILKWLRAGAELLPPQD